jgi:hypothetical protein
MLNSLLSQFTNSSSKNSETSESDNQSVSTPSLQATSKSKRPREASQSPEADNKRYREKSPLQKDPESTTITVSQPEFSNEEDMSQHQSEEFIENLLNKYEMRMKKLLTESEDRNAALIRDGLQPVMDMVNKIKDIENKISRTDSTVRQIQKSERKNNIIAFGITDSKNETYAERDKAIEGLSNSLKIKKLDYSDAFRLGIKLPNKDRPLLIKLVRYTDKIELMKSCKNLKGTKISIDDDNTPEERKAKSELYKKMKDVLKQDPGASCKVNPNRLIIRSGGRTEVWKFDSTSGKVMKDTTTASGSHSMDQHK